MTYGRVVESLGASSVPHGRHGGRDGGQRADGVARPRGMIHDLVRYGDPRLLAENADADPASPELPGIVADMIETCHPAPGIARAAPQIGVDLRVAIIDLSVGADPDGVLVLVNPVIVETSGEQKEEEGCLSVPDVTERVLRPARVRVRAADLSGAVREV